jgi:hypothetical protein
LYNFPLLLNLEFCHDQSKKISVSDPRDHIRTVFSEVYQGRAEYVVLKFGPSAAVIVSPTNFQIAAMSQAPFCKIRS